MSTPQLALPYDGKGFDDAWWGRVLREFCRVIDYVGLKEAAYQMDAKPSAVAHAMAERDRHHVRGRWLVVALRLAPDLGLARSLVEPAGAECNRRVELTPEERLDQLQRTIRARLGPLGDELIREAGR